jgi:hypothetical protein
MILILPNSSSPECERELRKAVGKGRYMIREMMGVIQLKKYRTMKRRYDDNQIISADGMDLLLAKYLETTRKP